MKRMRENRDIIEFSTLESQCVYQKDKKMKMQYKYVKNPSFELNSMLTTRGWRRFGKYFSRPVCRGCRDCISLKIDVKNFEFSKSVRRVYKKNKKANTKYIIQTPSVSKAHIELYKKYHKFMQQKKGWEYHSISEISYYDLYVAGHSFFGKEVLYFIDDRLVGVDLIDFLKDGISSIYFYYDPDFSYLSLGRYSIYKQIEFAKKMGLSWIYLGYAVENSDSLKYKFDYKPHKILINNPSLDEEAIWI